MICVAAEGTRLRADWTNLPLLVNLLVAPETSPVWVNLVANLAGEVFAVISSFAIPVAILDMRLQT
jgi:hypothetical protein